MRFRPCIDIHNGKVKQIVGGSLRDNQDTARENFVSSQDAAWYAEKYRRDGLKGGHVILLNHSGSPYFHADREQALRALRACPGDLQVGGGINDENAADYLDAGASHVIVTSFVFREGKLNRENLNRMLQAVGKERLVLDLSCRRRDGSYYIVTDRWQKFTDMELNGECLEALSSCCSEFLIHAVDAEGKTAGIEEDLAALLGEWQGIPVTYAGGVGTWEDLALLERLGRGKIDVTVGSALDLFGGTLSYAKLVQKYGAARK